jgi:Fe-S cluster assembly scaffold protein SufB
LYTYPYMEIDDKRARIGHEATVSKVGDDQLFSLMSRGLTEQEATAMILNAFIEPIVKTLPMEYAVNSHGSSSSIWKARSAEASHACRILLGCDI